MQPPTAAEPSPPISLSQDAAPVAQTAQTPPVFRILAIATFVATFALIIVGGIVRLSDSGLGCGPAGAGLEGWPFCDGGVIPALESKMIIEYTHRALASIVGVLLIALTWIAWRSLAARRDLVALTTITLALVIAEGLLGALTVEHGLHPWLVAIHLGISMVIAALLLVLVFRTRSAAPHSPAPQSIAERTLALLAPALLWGTIFVGGYVAGTQLYGTPGYEYSVGAHMACGDEFPSCLGRWWPYGLDSLVDAQLAHRLLMYLASIAVVALSLLILVRRPGARVARLAWLSLSLLAAQILLGAANVWFGEHRGMILAHLTLATLLWLALVGLVYFARGSTGGAPAPSPAPAPADAPPRADDGSLDPGSAAGPTDR